MDLTAELAKYCASLEYDAIPDSTVDQAKRVLLDTVGIAVGSVRANSTPTVVDTLDSLDEGKGATALATDSSYSPAYAALANATFAHSLDFDETHRAGSVHAAAPVLGTLLAIGEEVDATGRELLTAFVGGYEITARLGMALDSEVHYDKGFHATSTCGVYGATAAGCMLRGANVETIETAFGVNGSQSSGTLQFLENGSWNKRIHPGLAAHSGYLATEFARRGFFAASEPIEGPRGFLQAYSDDPRPDAALNGLGDGFEIDKTGMKPYPVCRFMHPAIDGLVGIATEHDIDPAEVSAIEIGMSTSGKNIVGDPAKAYPESIVDAQFSMPFGAMLSITRREAGVDALFEAVEGGFDPEERRLMDATMTTSMAWADDLYPDKWAVEVVVEAQDRYERRVEDARGDPRTPLSWAEIREKYDDLTVPVVGQATSETLRKRVESLESESATTLLKPLRNTDFRKPY
jgi:2-methylcitrate dehydratase PrpD